MRNPLRSEAEAYHFVIFVVVGLGAIATASLIGGFVAGAASTAVAALAAAAFYLGRGRPKRQVRTAPPHVGGQDERRVLVLANEALDDISLVDGRLVDEIRRVATGFRGRVWLTCPIPVSSIRYWADDVDEARERAAQRLEETLRRLRARGIEARGEIGSEDALQSAEDALRTFGADEIIVVTRTDARRSWLDPGFAAKVGERFALPVTHIAASAQERARRPQPLTTRRVRREDVT